MMTRRRTLGGLLAATFGGGVLTAGAFSSSSTAAADLRVVVTSELTLTPEREDEAYVEVDQAGELTIVLENDSQAGVSSLNQAAVSRFEELVRITNNGDITFDELDFEFEVTDDNDDRVESVEEALGIIHEGTVIHDGGGVATILQGEGESLGPGENEVFGVEVDLSEIGDFPEASFDVELRITAKREEG